MYISEHSPAIPHAMLAGFGGQQGVSLKSLFASNCRRSSAGRGRFLGGRYRLPCVPRGRRLFAVVQDLPDRTRAVMGFAFTGELIALWMPGFHTETAEAITEVRLHRLTQAKFQAAVDASDRLAPTVAGAELCEKMSATQRHLVVLGQLTAEERVAHFLTTLAHRTEADRTRPIIVELPMTRLDIADYLGLTIETVCRVISKFKRDGLLELRGRQSLRPETYHEVAAPGGGDRPR